MIVASLNCELKPGVCGVTLNRLFMLKDPLVEFKQQHGVDLNPFIGTLKT